MKKVALKKSDKLIILGDIIDRGPDNKGVIDTILLLKEHDFDVKCLKGNHEELLLDALGDTYSKVNWFRNGGNETFLYSYCLLLQKEENNCDCVIFTIKKSTTLIKELFRMSTSLE